MTQVYVGIGSNQQPEQHLCAGIAALKAHFGALQISTVYQSKAVGFDGADFLNAVIGFETDLSAAELKKLFKQLEQAQGRTAEQAKFSSRRLDIDLLLWGEQVEASLKLPHPDILNYPFVLFPLVELAPNLCHPALQQPLSHIAQNSQLTQQDLSPVRLACLD